MWAGAQLSLQETQNQNENGRHYTHVAKKLLDFCISQEEQQKLEKATTSTLNIPCTEEHWRSLLKPGASPCSPRAETAPAGSVFCPVFTAKGWGNFTSPRLFQNFSTGLTFLLRSHWREAGLATPHKWESFLRWFEAVLNKAKIPVPNSHWYINSAIEHKPAIFHIFVLKIMCRKSPVGLNIQWRYSDGNLAVFECIYLHKILLR